MWLKTISLCCILILCHSLTAQVNDSINKTDSYGKKQGHWIKKYPGGNILYDGYFKDDKPTGEFKRFFENSHLSSVLIFSNPGKEAQASLYHPNGFIASEGKYINQLKEGKWKYYSANTEGCLICEEEYSGNIRNGTSVKFYPDSKLAEKLSYVNDVKQGEWTQYFLNGTVCLKANYVNGKLQGKFEVFFFDGKPEYSGQYKDDARDGTWYIYNKDGSLKSRIDYTAGVANNPDLYKKESDYLDDLDKNKGKIADPEITGTIWK